MSDVAALDHVRQIWDDVHDALRTPALVVKILLLIRGLLSARRGLSWADVRRRLGPLPLPCAALCGGDSNETTSAKAAASPASAYNAEAFEVDWLMLDAVGLLRVPGGTPALIEISRTVHSLLCGLPPPHDAIARPALHPADPPYDAIAGKHVKTNLELLFSTNPWLTDHEGQCIPDAAPKVSAFLPEYVIANMEGRLRRRGLPSNTSALELHAHSPEEGALLLAKLEGGGGGSRGVLRGGPREASSNNNGNTTRPPVPRTRRASSRQRGGGGASASRRPSLSRGASRQGRHGNVLEDLPESIAQYPGVRGRVRTPGDLRNLSRGSLGSRQGTPQDDTWTSLTQILNADPTAIETADMGRLFSSGAAASALHNNLADIVWERAQGADWSPPLSPRRSGAGVGTAAGNTKGARRGVATGASSLPQIGGAKDGRGGGGGGGGGGLKKPPPAAEPTTPRRVRERDRRDGGTPPPAAADDDAADGGGGGAPAMPLPPPLDILQRVATPGVPGSHGVLPHGPAAMLDHIRAMSRGDGLGDTAGGSGGDAAHAAGTAGPSPGLAITHTSIAPVHLLLDSKSGSGTSSWSPRSSKPPSRRLNAAVTSDYSRLKVMTPATGAPGGAEGEAEGATAVRLPGALPGATATATAGEEDNAPPPVRSETDRKIAYLEKCWAKYAVGDGEAMACGTSPGLDEIVRRSGRQVQGGVASPGAVQQVITTLRVRRALQRRTPGATPRGKDRHGRGGGQQQHSQQPRATRQSVPSVATAAATTPRHAKQQQQQQQKRRTSSNPPPARVAPPTTKLHRTQQWVDALERPAPLRSADPAAVHLLATALEGDSERPWDMIPAVAVRGDKPTVAPSGYYEPHVYGRGVAAGEQPPPQGSLLPAAAGALGAPTRSATPHEYQKKGTGCGGSPRSPRTLATHVTLAGTHRCTGEATAFTIAMMEQRRQRGRGTDGHDGGDVGGGGDPSNAAAALYIDGSKEARMRAYQSQADAAAGLQPGRATPLPSPSPKGGAGSGVASPTMQSPAHSVGVSGGGYSARAELADDRGCEASALAAMEELLLHEADAVAAAAAVGATPADEHFGTSGGGEKMKTTATEFVKSPPRTPSPGNDFGDGVIMAGYRALSRQTLALDLPGPLDLRSEGSSYLALSKGPSNLSSTIHSHILPPHGKPPRSKALDAYATPLARLPRATHQGARGSVPPLPGPRESIIPAPMLRQAGLPYLSSAQIQDHTLYPKSPTRAEEGGVHF